MTAADVPADVIEQSIHSVVASEHTPAVAVAVAHAIRAHTGDEQLHAALVDALGDSAGDQPTVVAEQLGRDLEACADVIAAAVAPDLAVLLEDRIDNRDAMLRRIVWAVEATLVHAEQADRAMADVAEQVGPMLSGGIGGLLGGLRGQG